MFDRWFDSQRWWLCALSGLLLVFCFAPFSCATLAWVALVPAWWALTRSERVRQKPVRHGYLLGVIYFGGVFWWICNVTAIGAFFLVLYLALYPAIWFLFVARLLGGKRLPVLIEAPAAAALWVALEWWRSWFLTGFNWNELGISQGPSLVFRQLAAFGGVHLISFALVTVNILWAEGLLRIVETAREKRVVRASLPFATALFLVASLFALGGWHLYDSPSRMPLATINFACIQPNIPQIPYESKKENLYWDAQDAALISLQKLSQQAIAAKPDLLVWPEAILNGGVFQTRSINEAVHDICVAFDGNFLLGSQDYSINKDRTPGKLYNAAYLFTSHFDNFQRYHKTHLVILGEFLPFSNASPWVRKQLGVGGMDFTPGDRAECFQMTKPKASFAPLICFEDTLASVGDKAAKLKPDFFVTITNDGWYTGWCATWGVRQHLQHAVFRCVEHDRPMLRGSNTGISCVVDRHGTVTSRYTDAAGREIDIGGIYAGQLVVEPARATLYEAWGDWIILISSLFSLMLGLRYFYRQFAP